MRWRPIEIGMTATVALALSVSASPAQVVYDVEAVEAFEAVVDFGGSRVPAAGAPPHVTIVGSDRWSKAKLARVEDRCADLCGEGNLEGRECHKVGVYVLKSAVALPAIAIAGENSVEGVRPIALEATREDPGRVIDRWVSSEFQAASNLPGSRLRWNRAGVGRGFDLEWEYSSGGDQWVTGETRRNVPLSECKVRRYDDLINVQCENGDRFEWGASWLYHGAKLVLNMADSDWERSEIDLLSRFALDGSTYYLVRVGEMPGLLERTRDGWRFHPTRKDYATIC